MQDQAILQLMQLVTKRLFLRDHFNEDWISIHEYAKEPDFSKYDFWGPNTEDDTKEYVRRSIEQEHHDPRYKFDFAVVDRASGKVIGGAGIRRDSENSSVANIGYGINPMFQKKGLAAEAAAKLIEYGFTDLKVSVIWATCDSLNHASYRVMEKCDMKKVGHFVRHKELKGRWRDTYRYEITSPEFNALQRP